MPGPFVFYVWKPGRNGNHPMKNLKKKLTLLIRKKLLLKKILFLLTDSNMILFAWFGAYWLRFSLDVPVRNFRQALELAPWIFVIQVVLLVFFRLDRLIPRYTSLPELLRVWLYSGIGALAGGVFVFFYNHGFQGFPRSVPLLDFLLLGVLLGGWRILPRIFYEHGYQRRKGKRALIVGAGQAGEMLVRDMTRQEEPEFTPVGFLDDNRDKKGRLLHGIPVLGLTRDLPAVVKKYGIEYVILAMPSANRKVIRRLAQLCEQADIPYYTLPSTNDLISGRITVSDIREVTIEDLLGREPVTIDERAIKGDLEGQVVLVTGAGGSIGSELCRQIARHNPGLLIMLEASEYNLFRLSADITKRFPDLRTRELLGDIRNEKWLLRTLEELTPAVIFHAAAYKHVPMVEHNPAAGIDNNVLGSISVANAANETGVRKFVMISTDKAVNPTNVMGATKRIAEIYCQNFDRISETAFITTRFGNVLNSSGSVIPLFREQIARGGPVTVTHPDIERFFMTIPEACQLVLQASSMGKGGEIFVLDMGEPVKIKDLAEQLIRLSGMEPHEDIPIVYTGLRPGEKLYEELFHPSEKLKATGHPKILLARSREVEWVWFRTRLKALHKNLYDLSHEELKKRLWTIIPEYRYDDSKKEASADPF